MPGSNNICGFSRHNNPIGECHHTSVSHGVNGSLNKASDNPTLGVGNGSQQCRWAVDSLIAIPTDDGQAQLHSLRTPVVEGYGAALPGLLGLDSRQSGQALTCGRQQLILPGPGI